MTNVKRGKYLIPLLLGLLAVAGVARAQVDTMPPSQPTAVSASLSNYTQMTVSWTASTDNVGVVGYYVYRNGVEVANTPNTSYTDTINPGSSFSYTVVAYDAAGNVSQMSAGSAPVSAPLDTTPPSDPTWISVSPATSSIMLSWNPSTDDVGVIGYYIYRNGNKIPGLANPFTATTYDDTGLLQGNNFTYKIAAYDAAGNTSYSVTTSTMTLIYQPAPSTPNSVFVSVKSSSEIDLTWTPSEDGTVAGYDIYANGSQIATVSSTPTSYADTGLAPNTAYLFSVAAFNSQGNVSNPSFSVQGVTSAPDTTPPSKPFNLVATPVSTSEIDLSWSPSTDNVGVTGYYVYQDGNQIGNTASTTFADTGLASSTSYSFYVAAYDAAGNVSSQATVYNVWTPAVNPVAPPPVVVTPPPAGSGSGSGSGNTSGGSAPTGSVTFTTSLYYGLRSSIVTSLQTFLIQQGYLGQNYATGFYGSLTQKAVQQFQCAQAIVCSGAPGTTGWGSVGPKTRKALNALY